jgi:hypothetical protein
LCSVSGDFSITVNKKFNIYQCLLFSLHSGAYMHTCAVNSRISEYNADFCTNMVMAETGALWVS